MDCPKPFISDDIFTFFDQKGNGTIVVDPLKNPCTPKYLMAISESERKLDAGRFINFSRSSWEDNSFSIQTRLSYQDQFTDIVNWISENLEGKWSFKVEFVYFVGVTVITSFIFSFENLSELMYFTLRWK